MTVGSLQFPSVELASKLTPSDAMDSSPPTHTNGFVLILFRLLFTSSASLQTLPMGLGSLFSQHPLTLICGGPGCPIFVVIGTKLSLDQHF